MLQVTNFFPRFPLLHIHPRFFRGLFVVRGFALTGRHQKALTDEAAIQLETSVTNCQTAINQNKDRCQAEYKAEAKAEAEAKAKANGMTKAQVIANAKAKAEAKAEAKAKAKAEAKVEDKAEAKVENKAETKVESNESNNGKATRHLGWCGGMMDGQSLPTVFFPRGLGFHSNDKLVM
jgi:hypothetical protein